MLEKDIRQSHIKTRVSDYLIDRLADIQGSSASGVKSECGLICHRYDAGSLVELSPVNFF